MSGATFHEPAGLTDASFESSCIRVGTLMRSPTGAPMILPAGGGTYTLRPWGEWVLTVGTQTVTVTVPATLAALNARLTELLNSHNHNQEIR